MKKIFMIAALAAAVGFTSCSSDSNEAPSTENTPVSIYVKLSNETATRALDNIDGLLQTEVTLAGDGKVNVFMFDAAGVLIHKHAPTATELSTGVKYENADIPALTTSTTKVVVVGNVGDITTSVSSYATLQGQLRTLEAAETDYKAETIWVYGESGITWGAYDADADVTEGTATLDINPLLSRIDLTVDLSGLDADANGYNGTNDTNPAIEFNGAAVLYSGAQTHMAPKFFYTIAEAQAATAKPFVSGMIPSSATYQNWETVLHGNAAQYGTAGAETILHGAWAANTEGTGLAEKYTKSFYAFAPDPTVDGGYSANTIVTVYGNYFIYDEDDVLESTTPMFWPVHFSKGESATGADVLEAGKYYDVTIKFTGDLGSNHGGGGGENPETPINKANVTVKIKPAQWKAKVVIEKEFQGGN